MRIMNSSTYPNNPQEATFVPVQKYPYHVTFNLDLDHTMDARYLSPSCASLVEIRPLACEK